MADDDLSMKATLDASQAINTAHKFTDALADLSQSAGYADKTIDKIERTVAKVTAQLERHTKSVTASAEATQRSATLSALKAAILSREEKKERDLTKAINDRAAVERRAARGQSPDQLASARAQADAEAQAVSSARQASRDRQTIRSRELSSLRADIQERARLAQEQARIDGLNSRSMIRSSSVSRVMSNTGGASSGYQLGGFFSGQKRAADDAAAANLRVQKSLEGMASARYAMYDVARALTLISAASIGAVGASIKLEASYESLLVQVKRTSQTSGDAWGQLRTDLIDLTTAIPATIEDVSSIATLGGQLGIASEDIDSFTESVIKFSATTNVSATAAAESLGRVAQLSGVDSSQYDQLAASIYQVGITSISTEADILAVAQQIAVSANSAGFAAEQTIALASALASLGVAPERARGSIQRIFNVIENSVADGGDMLQQFASVSGTSADKFAETWSGDPQTAFQDFLAGLGRAEDAGGNINNILSDLGINAVRDTDALKRLAQNTDVYAKAISEASEGWNDGSVFAEGYGEVADTLDAKLTVLGSTLKAILEAVQDNEALKKFVDLLQFVADKVKEIARSPLGSAWAAMALAVGALVGGFALLGAGAVAAYASLLAMVTAMSFMTKETVAGVGPLRLLQISLLQVTGAANGMTSAQIDAAITNGTLSTSLRGTGVSATFAATAMKALRGALITTGIGAAIVAVGFVAESLYSSAQDTKAAAKELKEAIQEGISTDTKAWEALGGSAENTVDGFTSMTQEVKANTESYANNSEAVNSVLGTQVQLQDTLTGTEEKLRDVTYALGESTKAALDNALVNKLFPEDQSAEEAQKTIDRLIAAQEELGISTAQIKEDIANNDFSSLEKALQRVQGYYQEMNNAADASSFLTPSELQPLEDVLSVMDTGRDAINDYGDDVAKVTLIQQLFGDEAAVAAQQMYGLTDAEDEAAGAAGNLADGLFDVLNAQAAITQSTFDLGAAVAQNGTDFSTFTEGGRANIAAFSQAVSNAAQYAGEDTALFTSLVEQMIAQLEGLGVTGARQIAINAGALSQGTATAQSNTTAIALLTGQVAAGFNKSAQSAKKVGSNAGGAAKQVRTLSDYVSDLSKVMKDAFDFQFGFGMAQDDTAGVFRKIADSIKEAENNARDLRNTLSGLASDKSILEYQLSIATEYGDTLRVDAIRAELDKTNADLADTTQELADQQDFLNKDLEGGTEASAEHRDMVLDLLKAYEDQLTAYADTGVSQQELARYSDVLKQKFQDQLRALGYNTTQVNTYATAFDKLRLIIEKVPRNLTITASTDPAQRALDEFFAKNANRSVSISTSADTTSLNNAVKRNELYAKILAGLAVLAQKGIGVIAADAYSKNIAIWSAQLQALPAYAKGGRYPGGLALVGEHGPELIDFGQPGYVYTAPQTQQMISAAHSGRGQAPAGLSISAGRDGNGLSVVDLSAGSIQRLAQAVQPLLELDGNSIAKSTNRSNQNLTRRGGN